jgi:23S rRNA (guanine745-N1)-methyltransferase
MTAQLLCTVRQCHAPLERRERAFVCPLGHSYDVARSGYVNLLQPQERRSKAPGDAVKVVAARRRIHDRGLMAPLLAAVGDMLALTGGDVLLDVGCGVGWYAGELARVTGCAAHGVDISSPAIDLAARRHPECQWVVANADRFVPYGSGSFSAVMSITARMNAPEFRRVLRDDGRLLVGVPAPDDLIELRGRGRDRVRRTIDAFAGEFTVAGQRRATTTAEIDEDTARDLRTAIYRPRGETRIARVTMSLDLLLFDTGRAGSR